MSRSWKHTPRCGERKGRYAKRLANRMVRRTAPESGWTRGTYRKAYESWNICDYENVGLTFAGYRLWERNQANQRGGIAPEDHAAAYRRYRRWYLNK